MPSIRIETAIAERLTELLAEFGEHRLVGRFLVLVGGQLDRADRLRRAVEPRRPHRAALGPRHPGERSQGHGHALRVADPGELAQALAGVPPRRRHVSRRQGHAAQPLQRGGARVRRTPDPRDQRAHLSVHHALPRVSHHRVLSAHTHGADVRRQQSEDVVHRAVGVGGQEHPPPPKLLPFLR